MQKSRVHVAEDKNIVHYNIYKDSIHAFNRELGKARQSLFSNIVSSNLNNTHTVFATVERLTNPPSQIPKEMLSDRKCNEFASFFSEKINNIRKEISASLSCAWVRHIRPQHEKVVKMSDFKEIDGKILRKNTLKHKPAPLTHFPHLFSKVYLTV